MSTIAIIALQKALKDAEAEKESVEDLTADVIAEGKRAQARLTAAEHAVSSLTNAIKTLEDEQRGVVVDDD